MAFFSAVTAAVSAAFTWVTTTAVGQFVGSLAFSALANRLNRPKQGSSKSDRPLIERSLRKGTVPRSFIVGRTATGGSFVHHNSCKIDPKGDDHEYYLMVIALSDLPVRGLNRMWIDGKEVTLNGGSGGKLKSEGYSDYVVIPEYNDTEDDNGKSKAWYKFYDGNQTSADKLLVDKAGTDDFPWDEDCVGRGIAYIVLVFDYDTNLYPSGFPTARFEVDGIRVTLPSGTAISDSNPKHDVCAAQMYHIMRGVKYEGEWLYGPQVPGQMPQEVWDKAIADCLSPPSGIDSWTTSSKLNAFGSGTAPPKYLSGLEISVDRTCAETLKDLSSACAGRFAEVAGEWKFQVGDPPSTSDFHITDDDILDTREKEHDPFRHLAETVNYVSAIFPDEKAQYEDEEAKTSPNAKYEEEDGNRRLSASLRLDAVHKEEQAQRLVYVSTEEHRRARKHIFVLPPEYWVVEPNDYFTWDSEEYGYINKMFRVEMVDDEDEGDVLIEAVEVDPEDYDFKENSYIPANPVSAFNPGVRVFSPIEFSVAPSFVYGNFDTVQPAIEMIWDKERPAQGLSYKVYNAGTNDVASDGDVSDYRSGTAKISQGLFSLTDYEVVYKRIVNNGISRWSRRYSVKTGDYRVSQGELNQAVQDAIRNAQTMRSDLKEAFLASEEELFNTVDVDLSGAVSSIRETYATKEGLAGLRTELSSDQEGLSASFEEFQAAQTSLEQSVATFEQNVNATIGEFSASVETNATAVANLEETLSSVYSIKVTNSVGGRASVDFVATVDGSGAPFSQIVWKANQFQFQGTLDAFGLSVRTLDIIRNALSDNVFATRDEEIGGYGDDYRSYLFVSYSAPSNIRYDAYVYATVYGAQIGVNIAVDDDDNVNERLRIQVNDAGADGETFDNGTVIRSFTGLSGSHSFKIVGKRAGFSSNNSPKIVNGSIIVHIVKQGEK